MTLEDLLDREDLPEDVREAIRDQIAEHERAEKALEKSEAEREALLAAIPGMIFLVKRDGTYLDFIPAKGEAPTVAPEVFVGKRLSEILPTEIAESQMRCIEQALQTGTTQEAEYAFREGNETRIYGVRFAPCQEDSVAAIAHDITDRKRPEEALRQSEERFRTLVSEMINGFALHEIICNDAGEPCDYRFLLVNRAFEKMVGLAAADVVGKTVREVLPDTEDYWIEIYGRVALTAKSTRFEEYSAALQKHFEVLAYSPAKGQFATVFTDITDRRHGAEALKRINDELQLILDSSPVAIWFKDDKNRILRVNKAGADAVGLPFQEIVGKTAHELFPGEADHYYEDDLEVIRSGKPKLGIIEQMLTSSGEKRWVKTDKVPYRGAGGEVAGVIAIVDDITELKRGEETRRDLEAQLQHAQKLESLGVLAGGVAHDFNNLLVGMLGHSSLALNKLPSESPARRNIEGIMQAAERAADLSRQMLAYSGHGHFIVKTTDLSALVRENVHLLKAGIAKEVQLRTDLSETPAHIAADVGQIQQVIMNLVINGAEAIGDRSGCVTISTGFETLPGGEKRYSRFTATELDAGRYVFLEVRDDGPGMDEETLSKATASGSG